MLSLLGLDADAVSTLASVLMFAAGFTLLLKQVRMAMGLFVAATAVLVLPEVGRALLVELKPLIIHYLSTVPMPVVGAIVLLLGVVAVLHVLQRLLTLFFGREAAAVVIGELLARLVALLAWAVLIWPFRLVATAIAYVASRLR